MTEQTLTVGRFVRYTLSKADADQINRRRSDATANLTHHQKLADGSQIHVGNSVSAGQVLPALVVATFGGTGANLQVFLDGNDTYWATSRPLGEPGELGTWRWPGWV